MRVILAALHSKYIHSSLALSCLTSYCRDIPGCELSMREYTVHEPKENLLADILAADPDLVAFSVYIWNRNAVLQLADALAIADSKLCIILGGPEISFEGADFFKTHPAVTAIVRGEGEATFHEILERLMTNRDPAGTPGTLWNTSADAIEGPPRQPLENLDSIPSPFESGLVDLSRGFVYLETSRGCPFRCLFCMSALEDRVRSFSMERIRRDLAFLLSRKVPKIKLVDRTFNYDPERARKIFSHILENNRASHCHFEIAAGLLDDETIRLLGRVPEDMFQFEIGIQSCSQNTLNAVQRNMNLERTLENVARLRAETKITLHLDLIAGLPYEKYSDFLDGIDRIAKLQPHHLQIELVKLLPGSLMRRESVQAGIDYDPHPPYSVLKTRDLNFAQLSRLRDISRIMDITFNSGHFRGFLEGLALSLGSLARGLEKIADYWQKRALFRNPLQRKDIFRHLVSFIRDSFNQEKVFYLTELLARDYARSERVVPGKAPACFDTRLSAEETSLVRELFCRETLKVKGKGIKVQYFAARFSRLPGMQQPAVLVFFYLSKTGGKMEIREVPLSSAADANARSLL